MRAASAVLLGAALSWALPASAARPLLDNHQWDRYFALFAPDVAVPWKPTKLRLDTYSGAPVEFAAYAVDPAEVIVAGANRSARAIDTAREKAVVRWRFSPPPGYRFESSDVTLPLGAREGFFVVEARRGDATQQVWVNRTHIGLLAKSSPEGVVVWGVDLRSGHPLGSMRVQFLVRGALVEKETDANGVIAWPQRDRPTFALAEDRASRAFATLLPQAPLPGALVAVRVASAVVRAGSAAAVVGFARRRHGGAGYRRAEGEVRVRLLGRGKTLAEGTWNLDAAGAFAGALMVPAGTEAGDYAVIASASGAVGGTSLHVDAASDLAVTVGARCPCAADADIPVLIEATRDHVPAAGIAVRVEIVRTPHVLPPGDSDAGTRWGTTTVLSRTVRTAADGHAVATIRPPSDGLGSTYSIRAATSGNGATASSQLSVPTSSLALAIEPDVPSVDVGQPIGFSIRAFDSASGTPSTGGRVEVRLSHGATSASQVARLDGRGRGHVIFHAPSLGSNLVLASATGADGRRSLDAAAVVVAPSALQGRVGIANADIAVTVDRERYRPGERVVVRAETPGAAGSALVTLEGARTYESRVVPVAHGQIATTLDLGDAQGDVRVAVAAVRDGAVLVGSAAVEIDGPGHPRALTLVPDHATYPAGAVASVAFKGGNDAAATVVARLTDGRPSDGAFFGNLADVLATGATSSENPAAASQAWHTWVAPVRSKASDIFAAEAPRPSRAGTPSLGTAAPNLTYWHVGPQRTDAVTVPLPRTSGTYVLSVLAVYDDGDVGAATTALTVR